MNRTIMHSAKISVAEITDTRFCLIATAFKQGETAHASQKRYANLGQFMTTYTLILKAI